LYLSNRIIAQALPPAVRPLSDWKGGNVAKMKIAHIFPSFPFHAFALMDKGKRKGVKCHQSASFLRPLSAFDRCFPDLSRCTAVFHFLLGCLHPAPFSPFLIGLSMR
jgi:hypothetical protein